MSNRISTVSVLKYAIFDNSSYYKNNLFEAYKANGTVDVSGKDTGYTDLTAFCETNQIYLAADIEEANYMISGFSNYWVMIIDAFFILFMIACCVFVVFISFWPLKAHHIPFFI